VSHLLNYRPDGPIYSQQTSNSNINTSNMTTTSRCRKFTHNIINMWQRESVRALQMICTIGFLRKLSTIDDVMKYRGMPVSRYLWDGILSSANS